MADTEIEQIESEVQDFDYVPASYDIVTYPADFTLEGLVQKFTKGQLVIPGFQRKFVWTIVQSSRLIESFLLGLPVPSIFLFTDPSLENKNLVIDGQQRLLSVTFFFSGYFGFADAHGKRAEFRLKGLNENSPFLGLTYEELKIKNEAAFNRLNDSVLRAFVVKQIVPKGHSSVYHIFERLNTGGTQLVGQEIRNCIFGGPLNDLLNDLNVATAWRRIYGKRTPDKRMRDVELILRFFALYEQHKTYSKPMKSFLSNFMGSHQNPKPSDIAEMKKLFLDTCDAVVQSLGEKPFNIRAGLNVAAFDSVCLAFARNLDRKHEAIQKRFGALIKDDAYVNAVRSGTTDEKVVAERIKKAENILFP